MTRAALTALSILAFWALTLAVLIFVGLTGNALIEANTRLDSVDKSLISISQHADPLSFQINKVNSSLDDIHKALGPIRGQADNLNGLLVGVNGALATSIDPAVADINGKAGQIENVLRNADRHAATVAGNAAQANGKVGILQGQAVSVVNALGPIHGDLSGSAGSLSSTSTSVTSVCRKVGALLLNPGGC